MDKRLIVGVRACAIRGLCAYCPHKIPSELPEVWGTLAAAVSPRRSAAFVLDAAMTGGVEGRGLFVYGGASSKSSTGEQFDVEGLHCRSSAGVG